MKTHYLLIVLGACIAACGCMPLTHMGSAPAVKPGHVSLGVGGNFVRGSESGLSLNAGLRIGILPRVDIGIIEDSLSSNADVKVHILTDQMAGIDLAASLGRGMSVLAVYNYYNVIISKDIGKHTPYFVYRNVYISEDKTADSDEDQWAERLFVAVIQAVVKDLDQLFVGDEYHLSNHTSFLVEAMFIPVENETDLFAVNAGFKFSF